MCNKIEVSIAQGLDVPNIFKDVPNFVNDVPRAPNDNMDHGKIDRGLDSPRIGCTKIS